MILNEGRPSCTNFFSPNSEKIAIENCPPAARLKILGTLLQISDQIPPPLIIYYTGLKLSYPHYFSVYKIPNPLVRGLGIISWGDVFSRHKPSIPADASSNYVKYLLVLSLMSFFQSSSILCHLMTSLVQCLAISQSFSR